MSRPSAEQIQELVAAAREVRERAYAPYSGFHVGAAVLAAGGELFVGANVENASYPVSVCAERNAVAAAVSAGAREIQAVAVVAGDEVTPPCGGCRQVLNEFGPDMLVVSESVSGDRKQWRLPELLPQAFGPRSFRPTPDPTPGSADSAG